MGSRGFNVIETAVTMKEVYVLHWAEFMKILLATKLMLLQQQDLSLMIGQVSWVGIY